MGPRPIPGREHHARGPGTRSYTAARPGEPIPPSERGGRRPGPRAFSGLKATAFPPPPGRAVTAPLGRRAPARARPPPHSALGPSPAAGDAPPPAAAPSGCKMAAGDGQESAPALEVSGLRDSAASPTGPHVRRPGLSLPPGLQSRARRASDWAGPGR